MKRPLCNKNLSLHNEAPFRSSLHASVHLCVTRSVDCAPVREVFSVQGVLKQEFTLYWCVCLTNAQLYIDIV